MVADLAGRQLLVAGDPRAAAAVADEALRRGAVVTLATGVGSEGGASTAGGAIRYDSASEPDVERAVDIVFEKMQGLDGLIVAIEAGPMPPLDEGDLQSWERCVMQPLRTTFWLARRGVHELLAAGRGGQVVFIIVSGRDEDGPGSGWIVESALLSLARSIAKEYGRRGITCNVVAGGSSPGGQRAAAEAALFLASPAAAFVTGECLRLAEGSTGCEST
jgi:NAD(P)-dependent dehydrogenase (short-subunit alcohol dehydrogenase family)